MATMVLPVIHIGTEPLALDDLLMNEFKYAWAKTVESPVYKYQPLVEDEKLNSKIKRAIYLIDTSTPYATDYELLKQLPANNVIFDTKVELSADIEDLFQIKNWHRLDFTDVEALGNIISVNFYFEQGVYKIDFDELRISEQFSGTVQQTGQTFRHLTGDFGNDWTRIASVADIIWLPEKISNRIVFEYATQGDAEIKVVAQVTDSNSLEVTDQIELSGQAIEQGLIVPAKAASRDMQIHILARGHGSVDLGNIHFRRTRGEFGEVLVGGKQIVDKIDLNQELLIYFDPGDLQPPLNIYFSGYQTAEKFEGVGMMARFGAPYMLVMDPRSEGGAFYQGSEEMENQLIDEIHHNLNQLGFDHHDVILSGLSMGTYGALYYGAKLNPAGIVIGKPVIELGKVASGERILRPNTFGTSLDMLRNTMGGVDQDDIERMNQHFWDVFTQGDFSNTTFAIAYMEQDDYDMTALPKLRAYLKENYPLVRLFSKGIEGRHNDNTYAVVQWFMKQYKSLLMLQFNRLIF